MGWGSIVKTVSPIVKDYGFGGAYYAQGKGLAKSLGLLNKKGAPPNNDAQQRNADYQAEVAKLNHIRSGTDTDRANAMGSLKGIDHGFDYQLDQGYATDLQNQMAGLNAQYVRGSRAEGLNAARRGVVGGSNDAENQSDLAAQFQSGAMNAVQGAQTRRAGLRNTQLQGQSAFRRSLLAGDPSMAQYYQQQAQQQGQAMTNAQQQQAFLNAFGQIRNSNQDAWSRGLGGAASGFGDAYSSSYGALS